MGDKFMSRAKEDALIAEADYHEQKAREDAQVKTVIVYDYIDHALPLIKENYTSNAQLIPTIKKVRELLRCPLLDAKNLVDSYRKYEETFGPSVNELETKTFMLAYMAAKKFKEAINSNCINHRAANAGISAGLA